MRKDWLNASALVRTVGTGCFALLLSSAGQGAEVRLRILETTDVHMNLLSYDYYQDKATDQYGLSRAVSLIKAPRPPIACCLTTATCCRATPWATMWPRSSP